MNVNQMIDRTASKDVNQQMIDRTASKDVNQQMIDRTLTYKDVNQSR